MTGRAGKTRNIFLVWLVWPLITLGIYGLVWWYKINREARDFDSRIEVNPVLSLLAVMIGWIIIVPPYVSVFRTGNRIAQMQERAGLQPTCNAWIGLILSFFFGLYSLYYQSELNKIWAHYGNPEEGTQVPLPAGVPGITGGGPVAAPAPGTQAQAYGAPASGGQAPAYGGQAPASGGQAQASGTQEPAPAAPVRQPGDENTQAPGAASQSPDGNAQATEGNTPAADGNSQDPGAAAQSGDGDTQISGESTRGPGESARTPGGSAQSPGTGPG